MRLKGRVAVVTGGGGGIGRSIARRLASDGADLVLLDVNESVEETARQLADTGVRIMTTITDVANAAQVRESIASVVVRMGAVDCLINNAGLTAVIAPLARMEDAQWEREIGVNLTGPFNLIRAVLPGMAERRWGRIVNISSAAARGGLFRQAGYSASKSGLLGLTRNVTLEYAAQGITCNAILPGLIGTPTVAKLSPAIMDYQLSMTPARRIGTTDEIAAMVAFLCTEEAGYVNGAEIDIDGGARLSPTVLGSTREVETRLAFAERARNDAERKR